MIVPVSLARENWSTSRRLKRGIREGPRILHGFFIIGEMGFLLLITVRNMADYEQFKREFFYDQHGIQTLKTFVVMDEIKRYGPVPVDL
ncbi:MAG: Lrp/AsnC ligand binding domain-containing protein [Pseudomonadota bacterium]